MTISGEVRQNRIQDLVRRSLVEPRKRRASLADLLQLRAQGRRALAARLLPVQALAKGVANGVWNAFTGVCGDLVRQSLDFFAIDW